MLARFNGVDRLGNSIVADTGVAVGVRTANPEATLDVNGDARVRSGLVWGHNGQRTDVHGDIESFPRSGAFESPDPGWGPYQLSLVAHQSASRQALVLTVDTLDRTLMMGVYGDQGNEWQRVVTTGRRGCPGPFQIRVDSQPVMVGGVNYVNTLCLLGPLSARTFENAAVACFALGGHVMTYGEAYLYFSVNPGFLPAHQGEWLGNRVGDDLALYIRGTDVGNFEEASNKSVARAFMCVDANSGLP